MRKLIAHGKYEEQCESALTILDGVRSLDAKTYLVPSRSQPGREHRVEIERVNGGWRGHCPCRGFASANRDRGRNDSVYACTHIVAALMAATNRNKEEILTMLQEDSAGTVSTVPAEFEKLGIGVMTFKGKPYVCKEGLLRYLHNKHTDASIETELKESEGAAIVKATITVENGKKRATGWGSASSKDTIITRLVEMAETRAVNRAIRHLFALPVSFEEINDEEE